MYNEDYIGRFRRKVGLEASNSATISDIIAQSTSKVEVTLQRLSKAIPVIFINDDKEAATESIMYTYKDDKVVLGDYINFLGDDYLVYKEIKNIKRENYINAFKLILCNVNFILDNSNVKAYFKGSLRSSTSQESNLAQNFGVDSYGESLIMIPDSIDFKVNKVININNKGWRSTYIDNSTNPGIKYIILEEYSLIDTSSTPIEPLMVEPLASIESAQELLAGITNSFKTEDAYLKADQKINIIKRTSNLVDFIIPFGIEEINITIKQNRELVSMYYKVRG